MSQPNDLARQREEARNRRLGLMLTAAFLLLLAATLVYMLYLR